MVDALAQPLNRLAKVPYVTFAFWVVKIAATTLGETGGDAVSMSLGLGYLVGSAIFAGVFIAAVGGQIAMRGFHPVVYWAAIVASTTLGTTLADFADRSLGIGYAGGSAILLFLVVASLFAWHRTLGSISIETVSTPKSEVFYWMTIMFSQTLGTALGDWTADTAGFGYLGAATLFGGLIAVVAFLYFRTSISRALLFWAAFVLTRPLGAALGDFLDKPVAHGGLAFSRFAASAALLAFMALMILIFRQRAAEEAH